MTDLEHFVPRSVLLATPDSCLCLLIDTEWGLLPHSGAETSGSLAGLHVGDLQPFDRSYRGRMRKAEGQMQRVGGSRRCHGHVPTPSAPYHLQPSS